MHRDVQAPVMMRYLRHWVHGVRLALTRLLHVVSCISDCH